MTVTRELQQSIQALYKDLGWGKARQIGFNRRTCGKTWPQTTREANKIYQGLEEILKRLVKPHYKAFQTLVKGLLTERWQMTHWERDVFLPDIARKMGNPAAISPMMIKKVREIAHKYGIAPGFPSFRELSAHYDAKKVGSSPIKSGMASTS